MLTESEAKAVESMNRLRSAGATKEWIQDFDEYVSTYKLAALSMNPLGDERLAFRLSVTDRSKASGQDFPYTRDTVYIRIGAVTVSPRWRAAGGHRRLCQEIRSEDAPAGIRRIQLGLRGMTQPQRAGRIRVAIRQAVLFFSCLFVLAGQMHTATAHPGNTDARGGRACSTNCPRWGLTYGQYHTHGGDPAPRAPSTSPQSSGKSLFDWIFQIAAGAFAAFLTLSFIYVFWEWVQDWWRGPRLTRPLAASWICSAVRADTL